MRGDHEDTPEPPVATPEQDEAVPAAAPDRPPEEGIPSGIVIRTLILPDDEERERRK